MDDNVTPMRPGSMYQIWHIPPGSTLLAWGVSFDDAEAAVADAGGVDPRLVGGGRTDTYMAFECPADAL